MQGDERVSDEDVIRIVQAIEALQSELALAKQWGADLVERTRGSLLEMREILGAGELSHFEWLDDAAKRVVAERDALRAERDETRAVLGPEVKDPGGRSTRELAEIVVRWYREASDTALALRARDERTARLAAEVRDRTADAIQRLEVLDEIDLTDLHGACVALLAAHDDATDAAEIEAAHDLGAACGDPRCMPHDALPTSHHPDCAHAKEQLARAAAEMAAEASVEECER